MLCYAAIRRIPASESVVLQTAIERDLNAFVHDGEGFDRLYVQACTTGELGPRLAHVLTFLTNHGYRPEVFGQDSMGNPTAVPFVLCGATGCYYPQSQMRVAPDRRQVHVDYFTANYFTCGRCSRSTAITDRHATPDPRHVYCGRCFQNNCRTCEECERVCWEHEVYYDDYAEEYQCRNCRNSQRGDEFDGETREFSRRNSFGSSRRYGIELETNRGTASDQFAFGAKDDGSIEGWEFVSHVLRGDEGMEEIRNFMASGHNIRHGENCGFHMHMDMRRMEDTERFGVFMAYMATENWWFQQIHRNRRENSYCTRMNPQRVLTDVKTAIERSTPFRDFCYSYNRYSWMNVSAFQKHGTFENRLHQSTWEFAEVKRWVILNLRFVRFARQLQVLPTDTIGSFADKANPAINFALEYFGESLPVSAPIPLYPVAA